MKNWITFFCSLQVAIVTMASEQSNLNQNYKLNGICNIDDTWVLSIKDKVNNQHFWLKVGQSYGDLKLSVFNPENTTATLFYQDFKFFLELSEIDNYSPIKVISSIPRAAGDLKRINQQVDEYRQGLMQALMATPDSELKNHKSQRKLEKNLEHAVANYRQRLMSESESNQADEISPSIDGGDTLAIIGVKRRNRVNSRIWASDHIKVHGMPDE